LRHRYWVRPIRSFIAAFLTGVITFGQLSASRCPMLSPNQDDTSSHAHDHAYGAPAPRETGALVEKAQSSDAQLPAPCLMTLNCSGAGITQPRTAILPESSTQAERKVLPDLAYNDPVLLRTTPPPRV
jgi:hypothetical protein